MDTAIIAAPGSVIDKTKKPLTKPLVGFFAAWIVFALVLFLMPLPEGMTPVAKKVLAVLLWAVIIWVTEAMPVGPAGLLIPALLVISGAVPKLTQALAGFSEGVSLLALVAFIFSAFMQLAGLDKRIALTMVQKFRATTAGRMVWSMFATNFILSFMIPANVARQGTLLPIVNGLIGLFGETPEERQAKKALAIHALTYATLICGIVIQTAHMPNLVMTGLFAKELNIQISFAKWFVMQCPILLVFLFTYVWTGWIFKHQDLKVPGGLQMINREKELLGKPSKTELLVLALFCLVALTWATESVHKIPTPTAGLLFLSLFFIPGLLPYKWGAVQEKTIWGTWLMLAGALSLSAAVSQSGLASYMANMARPIAEGHHWITILAIMVVATHIIRLGMLSNIAAIAMLAPVMMAMAPLFKLHPIPFTLIICNTDTFAYLLPTQTTAGVIAYSTGVFTFSDYAKVGIGAMIIAACWDIFFMSQWYAWMGFPIWQP
jgi:solute carrier family 13 (sodium-dependent dicarboxylate transporter), member 2/3/5